MVQICVQVKERGGSSPEWMMFELQGGLETKSQSVSLDGKFIGDLHFTPKNQPVLIIGHHILYGKCVNLEKPLAVLTKDYESQSEGVSAVEYNVRALVRRKMVFKTRPKPIIANVPKKV